MHASVFPQQSKRIMRTEELPSLYQQLQRKQNQGDEIISILVCLSHLNNPFTLSKKVRRYKNR